MTTLILMALLAGQPTSADGAFARSTAAHRAMRAASVTVETETRYRGLPPNDGRFDLEFVKPDHAVLRMRDASQDRTYAIRPGEMVGYDAKTNEVLRREAPPVGTLVERYVLLLGALDDAVQMALEPSVSGAFIERYRTIPKWTMRREAGMLRLESRAGDTLSRFDLDPSTFVVRRVRLEIPGGHLEWRYAYGPRPRRAAFAPPPSAVEVVAFYVGGGAEYEDPKAKAVAHACVKAHEEMRSGSLDVVRPEGVTRVAFEGRLVRQSGAGGDWAFDGRNLWVRRGGRVYRGKSTATEALGTLAEAGLPIEPLLRLRLFGRNVMRELLGPGMKARLVGTIETEGVPCDLLEISGDGVRVTAWVRRDNRLLARVGTENRDRAGALVSEGEVSYVYRGRGSGTYGFEGTPQPLDALQRR